LDDNLEVTRINNFKISYSETRIDEAISVQHYHDAYEVAFFLKANLEIFIKDMKYEIRDGDLLFIHEYDIHRIIYNTTTQYIRYVINFKKEFILPFMKLLKVDNLLEGFAGQPYKKIHLNLKDRSEIQLLFDALYQCQSNSTAANEISNAKTISNLLLVLIRISELFEMQRPLQVLNKRDKLVQEIVQFIDTNYMNPIDLDLLESRFFTDKFHISHIFKQTTGFSMIEYLQYRRVIEAQKMLKNSDKNIIDIYFDCGFNNVQHFYRVFKKVSKITPDKYRRLQS